MKTILSIAVFLSCISLSYSQTDSLESPRHDCYPGVHGLVSYRTVALGHVVKIKKTKFKVKIHESMKGRKGSLLRKRLTIQFSHGSSSGQLANSDYQLETGRDYLFMLGSTRWKVHKSILRWTCSRFVVQNDSLFIPTEALDRIPMPDEVNIHQKNTFEDPLFASGYKMSVADFRALCNTLNECFVRIKVDKRKRLVKTDKVNENFSDPFIEAIVKDYAKRSCKY